MTAIAIDVFVRAYVLIASDRINKTVVALGGAAIVVAVGVIDSKDVFYSRETGIDWDVIFLLLGMMVIVSVLRQTGVFEYVAIWAAKRAKGSPLRVMILLVCDRLAINATPFLIAEVFASNIGGASALVGDPPNIIIASRAGLTFNDFLLHMAPIVRVAMAVFVAMLPRLFRGAFEVDAERVAVAGGAAGRRATSSGPQVANSSLRPGSQDVMEQGLAEGEFSWIANQVETQPIHHIPVSDAGVGISKSVRSPQPVRSKRTVRGTKDT